MQPQKHLQIRLAVPNEADSLSSLARRSKAYWPYDEEFLLKCRNALTVNSAQIENKMVWVASIDNRIIGFYSFSEQKNIPLMVDLFVDPEWIGKGIGSKLWTHSLRFCRSKKWTFFELYADPYAAEKFYFKVGCKKIGEVESTAQPGRMLPVLRYDL